MNRRIWKIFGSIGIALFLFFIGFGVVVSQGAAPSGEALYKKQCAICHGAEGKGDGPAADFLFPKPRDFTFGVFKMRVTPSGSPPTDDDLFRTISNGMPGSAMPSFAHLSKADRRALVDFIKKLANITEKPERVISVPPEPRVTAKLLEQGKKVYSEMKCWECHGLEGRGDGPKAKAQVDDWGFPSLPADYTLGVFKGGGRPSDIYLRFTTGVDGSPMPSFEDSLTNEERWALTHYVLSFIRPGKKIAVQPKTGSTIVAKKVSGALPKDALDSQWNKVSETTIPLMRLYQRAEGADAVSVRALHNGKEIAFLLEWEDWEVNSSFLRHQDFTDSAAIMFSLSPKKPLAKQPHFTMGEIGGPVNIWYWRFDRQMDLAGFQDIEKYYPGMVADDYQLESVRYPMDTEAPGHLPVTSAPAHDPVFITGWGSGNLVSIPMRPSAVEDLNAEGFRTLTAQPLEDQNVKGMGIYMAGKWKVVFAREFSSKGSLDVQLKKGGKFPIGFAVWDGSAGDRDGQKSVTTWYVLNLK